VEEPRELSIDLVADERLGRVTGRAGACSLSTAAPAVTLDSMAKAERDHYFDVGGSQVILPHLFGKQSDHS
jgi:hypothetical protein